MYSSWSYRSDIDIKSGKIIIIMNPYPSQTVTTTANDNSNSETSTAIQHNNTQQTAIPTTIPPGHSQIPSHITTSTTTTTTHGNKISMHHHHETTSHYNHHFSNIHINITPNTLLTPTPTNYHPHFVSHSPHHIIPPQYLYTFKFEHILDSAFSSSNTNNNNDKISKSVNNPVSTRLFIGNHATSSIKSHVESLRYYPINKLS